MARPKRGTWTEKGAIVSDDGFTRRRTSVTAKRGVCFTTTTRYPVRRVTRKCTGPLHAP